MLAKGNIFLEKMMTAREKIAKKGAERLPDGAVSFDSNFHSQIVCLLT